MSVMEQLISCQSNKQSKSLNCTSILGVYNNGKSGAQLDYNNNNYFVSKY